jgi:hypothetical protein
MVLAAFHSSRDPEEEISRFSPRVREEPERIRSSQDRWS